MIFRWSVAVLLVAGLVAPPLVAQEARHPRHDRLRVPLPGGQQFPDPTMWYPFVPRVVAREPDQDWRQAGKVNTRLSDACRRGEFREYAPMRFRAIYRNGMLGVAFGHGLNLVDRRGLADPGMIYYFNNANSTACMVMQQRNPDPRVQERVRELQGGG